MFQPTPAVHSKPHPDAILVNFSTGETRPYPTGRPRDVAQDVADAKFFGYSIAVPIIKTASGTVRHISIEAQVGGVGGLEKVLRSQRRVGTGEATQYVRANMLRSEWDGLTKAQRESLLDKVERKADPRDAKIAELEAKLAAVTKGSQS